MAIYLIKQIPDDYAEATGLAKKGRSRMPGCRDEFQAGKNDFSGRFTTGLSKEEQDNYTQFLGKDVHETSTYWEDFRVLIDADKPRVFNTDNPVDFISYKMLIANGYVAPDKDAASSPEYRNTMYYAYTEETENQEETSTRKQRDLAISKLLTISDNKEKMLLYGQYLEGLKYDANIGPDTLYKMLRVYVEDKNIQNAKNFLEAFNIPVEQIQKKLIIDKALKARLIVESKLSGKKRAYQYGQVTLGSTLEEVYRNLSLPDFAPELLALKQEIEKR